MSGNLKGSGRQRDASTIRQANRASTVGRLMMGELRSWNEYLRPDTEPLEDLPRRALRSGVRDVKRNLSSEIHKFCERNFEGMTQAQLEHLYIDIAGHRGIEIPVEAFEKRYARFKRRALRGTPKHATVSISLWGLKFWFPEDQLSKDICCSMNLARKAMEALESFRKKSHDVLANKKVEIREHLRLRYYSSRTGLLAAFNLFECYLNSLAWAFDREGGLASLSIRQQKLLKDTTNASLRDKALKYPVIIAGVPLGNDAEQLINKLLDTAKPFRDALVHPSPFEVPERFGGYDKLKILSRLDVDTLQEGVGLVVRSIQVIQDHEGKELGALPWLSEIQDELSKELPSPWEGDRLRRHNSI